MYTSPDDARSDLFLAGAVYLFGPLLLSIVFGIVPLLRVPVLGEILTLILPLATTVLVPYLLIRYRREPLAMYGLGTGTSTVVAGVLLALPIAVASLLAVGVQLAVLPGVSLLAVYADPLVVAGRLLRWLGLAGLAVYGTVKARDAFRGDPIAVRDGLRDLGRIVAIVAAGAVALLILGQAFRGGVALDDLAAVVLEPLGAAAGLALLDRRLRLPAVTTRATLLTPLVLLALGPFALRFDAVALLGGIRAAAIVGAVGLGIGALLEARRNVLGAVAVAVLLGLFSTL